MIDRKQLKASARAAMREAKPHPVWVTLVSAFILLVLAALAMTISGTFDAYRALLSQLLAGQTPTISESASTSGFGSFLVFALEIMSLVISVGYVLYCLRVSRGIAASFGDIFDAFGIFLRAVAIRALRGLILFLWELGFALIASVILSTVLILVFPAAAEETLWAFAASPWLYVLTAALYLPLIAVTYLYRLADYFMLDNPGMSCFQCIAMSRMAMRGRKWELFKLDLSFIGWYLLSVIPLVGLWVQPYISVTQAKFYDRVVPLFMQDLEQQMKQRVQSMENAGSSHGYHIPGQNDDDKN